MESKKNSEEMNNVVETQSLDAKKRMIAALAKSGEPEGAGPLREFLHDKDRDVRRAAVRALGRIKQQSAVGAIIRLIETEKWHYVRSAAWKALKRISPRAYKETRIKTGTTVIQLFALNFRDLPWWIGLILLITPFFVHFLASPNFHYTYYIPLYYKYVLPAAGIFLFTGLLTKLFFNKKKDKKTAEKSGLKKEIIS